MRKPVVPVAAAAVSLAVGCSGFSAEAPDRELVRVPVAQTDVVDAYSRLREAGLRVAVRNSFRISTLCFPTAWGQRPLPRRRVPRDTVVTINAGGCDQATPAGHNHPARPVPNFVGKTVQTAVLWAHRLEIEWYVTELPPLPPSSAPNLLDNYRVVRQTPAPGTKLQRSVGTAPDTFRITPLELWGELR